MIKQFTNCHPHATARWPMYSEAGGQHDRLATAQLVEREHAEVWVHAGTVHQPIAHQPIAQQKVYWKMHWSSLSEQIAPQARPAE